MKKTMILATLMVASVAAAAPGDQPGPVAKLTFLSAAYEALCERVLEGVYVPSSPNFYQHWACEGDLKWCNLKPDAPVCEGR